MQNTPLAWRGMVTAPHHLAAGAGADILKAGGTAVEACVAMAASLAVVYPHMTGIGGDGFWLVHEPDGRIWALEACGAAAQRADLDFYQGHKTIPWRGVLAANTVAGTVGGWHAALQAGGSGLPLAQLLAAAIDWAETGVAVTRGGAALASAHSATLRHLPGAYAAIFEPDGRPLLAGERLCQPQLAQTLRRLVADGLESFYHGETGALIAQDLAALGSPLSHEDIQSHQARQVSALSVAIKDATIFNLPPPTQGAASLMILALFDRLAHGAAVDEFPHIHSLIEATKQAFMWRDTHCGDPVYMAEDAQSLLDDGARLDRLAAQINPARALPWPQKPIGGDTTWFGAADARGQVVSCIQSTYFEFGSGVVLPRTGIIWQNRGSSFRLAPDGWNALKPGRKPFHTLNPALAKFKDGRVMAYGTMGGEGQPQTQSAIFSRYGYYNMPLQEALSAPRWLLGRSWGSHSTTLKLENRFAPELVTALRDAGHDIEMVSGWCSEMGHAGAIVRHANGLMEGASDPRSDGAVAAF